MVRHGARTLILFSVLLLSLATAGTAFAGPVETPEPGSRETATLAATGLNVTVPVLIGLSLLVLGTLVIAWVALRGSRPSRSGQGG